MNAKTSFDRNLTLPGIWICFVTMFMVHIGGNYSISERIANDFEYFKTLGFTFSLAAMSILGIWYVGSRAKYRSVNYPWKHLLLLVLAISIVTSAVTFFYFKYVLDYEIEGSTLYNVDIPLIFFICLLTGLGFGYKNYLEKESVSDSKDPKQTVALTGYRGAEIHRIQLSEISFIHLDNGVIYVYTKRKNRYRLEQTSLRVLEKQLPKCDFFRLNRQIICERNTILSYQNIEARKLKVKLRDYKQVVREVIISKEKSGIFKKWMK